MQSVTQTEAIEDGILVRKAVRRAAHSVGINMTELGRIVGCSRETFSREGTALTGKPFELALIVIRVVRALSALTSGDEDNMKLWIRSYNRHLNGIPGELMQSVTGLANVCEYVDAMRAKV